MIDLFMPDDTHSLVETWNLHATKEETKHTLSANRYELLNSLIGYSAVILQAVVAMSVVGTFIAGDYGPWIKWSAIGVTIVSIGLVTVQTKGDFAKTAERHRVAALSFKGKA